MSMLSVARFRVPPSGALVAALVGALVVALSASASAQTLLHEFTGDSPRDVYGGALDAADLDGDGIADLIIGAPWDDAVAYNAGRVTVRSGATGALIRTWTGEGEGVYLGAELAAVGDIDGDGISEVLIGAPGAESAYLYSGATGNLLRTHEGVVGEDAYGDALGGVGDVTGDGIPDYGIGATTVYGEWLPDGFTQGSTQLHSGQTGELLANSSIVGGKTLRAAGDVNGDGTADYLCSRNQFAFGADQAQLRTGPAQGVLDTVTVSDGKTVAAPVADLDGDGLPEYVLAYGLWYGTPHLEVRSAVSGTLLSTTSVPPDTLADGNISVLDGRADLNGDGVPDILLGLPASDAVASNAGEALILSGVDLSELVRVQGQNDRGEFGSQVVVLGDWDGDGISDYAISEPALHNIGVINPMVPGVVRVYSGGALGWKDLGGPLAGAGGEPELKGKGFLLPGQTVRLSLADAAAAAPVGLVIGFAHAQLPFLGGVLGPSPDVIVTGLATTGAGTLSLAAAWPTGVPPATTIWFQEWIQDAGAPQGWAASNTVSGTNAP